MTVKSPLYLALATYRTWRHYPRGAVKYYQKLVDLHPKNDKLRFRLARSLCDDKQYEKCLRQTEDLLKRQASLTDYLYLQIKALKKLHRNTDVVTASVSMLKQHPRDKRALAYYADALLNLEDYDSAKDAYQQVLDVALDSGDMTTISYCYHSLGRLAELDDCEVKTVDYYLRALDYTQNDLAKKLGVGVLHQSRGWLGLAQLAFEAEANQGSKEADLYFQMGKLYTKLNKAPDAAEAYKKFVEYDNNDNQQANEKLVVFDAYMGRNYACSPRAIYEEMLHNPEYKDFTFVWAFRGSSLRKHWRLYLNRRTKIVKYKSKDYFRAYARAKYWITNSRLAYVLKSHPSQVYIQCWHGTPLKRMGHSIVDETEASKYDKNGLVELYDHDTKRIDYFLSPSKTASEYFTDAFGLKQLNKEDILVEEGYPRNDFLYNFTDKDVKRVKNNLKIPKGKKVLLYAPTWRDDQHDSEKGYTYKTQADFDYLQQKLGDEWVILFRAHYFIANSFDFRKYKDFIYDVSGVDDVNDLYIISDVLMTDYSSVFFDYANLRRPIIFFMYDLEHYKNNIRGFYFDFKKLPGKIITKEADAVQILHSLEEYSSLNKTIYDKFNEEFNYLDDGCSAARVLKRILIGMEDRDDK